MPMFTEADLFEALQECFIPALRLDVVTAKLVRTATLVPDLEAPGAGISGVPERFIARVTLVAPGGEEVVNAQTRASVENRLLGLSSISRVELKMLPALFSILH